MTTPSNLHTHLLALLREHGVYTTNPSESLYEEAVYHRILSDVFVRAVFKLNPDQSLPALDIVRARVDLASFVDLAATMQELERDPLFLRSIELYRKSVNDDDQIGQFENTLRKELTGIGKQAFTKYLRPALERVTKGVGKAVLLHTTQTRLSAGKNDLTIWYADATVEQLQQYYATFGSAPELVRFGGMDLNADIYTELGDKLDRRSMEPEPCDNEFAQTVRNHFLKRKLNALISE